MTTTTTLNMQLVLPVVGQTSGPDWATLLLAAMQKIDTHTHAQNNGVKVTPAGFNMSANMPCNDYSLTGLKSTTYQSQGSAIATPASVHNVNGDLYWVSSNGTAVQITNGAGLNLSSIGTIGGDYGQSGITASVVYSDSLKTFSFTQASGITAKMFLGDILLTPTSASQNSITIKAPTGCSAWTFTMPSATQTVGTTQAALTTNTSGVASHIGIATANTASAIVQRDASGNFSAGVVTANLTGNVTGNVSGNVSGNVTGNVTGNADSATNQSGGTVSCTTMTATGFCTLGGNIALKTTQYAGTHNGASTLTIAHGLTASKINTIRGNVYFSSSNNYSAISNITFDATNFIIGGVTGASTYKFLIDHQA